MDAYLVQSPGRRRTLCEQAANKLGLAPASIEKDFWICRTLDELFGLPAIGGSLTFKAGTSLSKGWKLIKRFSEDVNVVIARSYLGMDTTLAPEDARISGKEPGRRLGELQHRCQRLIADQLRPQLQRALHAGALESAGLRVEFDEDDAERQTLLVNYHSDLGANGYVRPTVKIELGARSDTQPVEEPLITPYLAEALPTIFPNSGLRVRTVAPTRTFWEKAMLLHEESFRAAPPKGRLSRHYYDLYFLILHGIGARAAADAALFDSIAAHRSVFFRKSEEARASLRPGSLSLLPRTEHLNVWKRDYAAMRDSMFFEEPPAFEQLLQVVGDFERAFNSKA